jgi:hypothetical protein
MGKPEIPFDNPFTVQTPEGISASDAHSLFVDVFSDFYQIPRTGHTFIRGPRGTGKSMMFRYLEPDCQCLAKKATIAELPFFAIYVPIKNTALDLAELTRLKKQHAQILFNEHLLTLYVAANTFRSLRKLNLDGISAEIAPAVRVLAEEFFFELLQRCGWNGARPTPRKTETIDACMGWMETVCDDMYKAATNYLKRIAFENSAIAYSGPLCGHADFLHPLFCQIRKLVFMPKGPIFLMIDDAENLNETQTRILNSWVATRSSTEVSIKISTQTSYKTYRTITGHTIDAPHDYSEVDVTEKYTRAKGNYRKRVNDIVEKRLERHDIRVQPNAFFPPDAAQEEKIAEIARKLREEWKAGSGRGYRADDDAYRYARPDYIKSLKGIRKSGSKYRYAGFDQLVDISSGVIRYFLEAAAVMFAEQFSENKKRPVRFIDPGIQSEVVRTQADQFMSTEFDKMSLDEKKSKRRSTKRELERPQRLRNLLMSMGATFQAILLSDRSERRVFSIALYDTAVGELAEILRLGVQYGYLTESAIGNKEGTGRTRLYVLSRRLAPYFLLDPSSFAGYLFVKSDDLEKSLTNPNRLLRNLRRESEDEAEEPHQMTLFG